jgi:hypothetical protein
VTFQHITNYYVARNWGKRQLDRSRFSREVSIQTYHKYIYLYPNANVTFTYPRFGWDKKKLRVVNMTMRRDGLVNLTLRDTDSSIYSDIVDAPVTTPPGSAGGVIKPSNFRFVDANTTDYSFAEGIDNVYGYLMWDPYEGTSLLRYEVEDWLRPNMQEYNLTVPYNRVVYHNVSSAPSVFFPITEADVGTTYMFKARTMDRFGNYSKYSVIEHKITASNLPSVYAPVTGFRATNVNNIGEYVGPHTEYEWDLHGSQEVSSYLIAIVDDTNLNTLGQVSIPATTQQECRYTFTIMDNVSMYANNNLGAIGAYRDYHIKIKAVASNDSSEWVYL